jgi:hypothetical protein
MPKADQPNTMEAATPASYGPKQTAHYAVVAATRAGFDATAAAFMKEVRAAAAYLKEYHGYSLTVFAEVTGLHKNSLMRLSDPTWIPKSETLENLDKLIVRADAKRRGEIFPGETIKRGRPRSECNEIA